jgi:hypothetical protein
LNTTRTMVHTLAAALLLGTALPVLAASDVKKAEHAVSGAAHRVGQSYHHQVKDYHRRQARKQARRGHYRNARHHAQKASWHAKAEHRQGQRAGRKERALRNE